MRSQTPTILQIVPELDTGGAELSTIEIAGAIAKAGGRAIVVSEGGRMAARIESVGGEFVPFAAATKNPLRILLNARRLRRLIQDERIDLVHARSRAPAWSAYLAAKKENIPFLTTYHAAYSETNRVKKKYNSVMAAGALVITNSRYTADLVHSRYGTPYEKMRVIYRGLDGAQFDPERISAERRTKLLTSWQLDDRARIVFHAARLSPTKGQATVIDAAAELKVRGQLGNTKFVIAGDAQGRNAYREQLAARIEKHGLEQNVLLVGHVDDIPAAMSLAHTAIVASVRPEAFGRVATEAQAMRCPVIATNIGAPPETVRAVPAVSPEDRTGWLVAPGDAVELADALGEALNLSENERATIGNRARAHVLKNFSLDAMRSQTLQAYDQILGTGLAEQWLDNRS